MDNKVKTYLKANVDDQVIIEPYLKKKAFPIFLTSSYHFYEMTILGTQCILVEISDDMPGVDNLEKHLKQINNISGRQVVLLTKEMTRYRRKSLIKNRIAFIIQDGQMFLPFLGLDLKTAQENIETVGRRFTTPAQIAYLYFLYHKDDIINVSEFAEKMLMNQMTASRALKELYQAHLITYDIGGKTGRSKEYKRIADPDYFQRGQQFLKTPVRQVIYAKSEPKGALIAGFDALAQLSMINSSGHLVFAIARNKLNRDEIEIIKNKDLIKDEQYVELQVWDYDPELFSDKKHVDILSLYSSLKNETDERVEQALEQVLQSELWYTG